MKERYHFDVTCEDGKIIKIVSTGKRITGRGTS
jgi:hypothetical protein